MTYPDRPLQPGTTAPDFTLRSTADQTVSLHELRGHPVVLVFYPADWSPVCTDELAVFNQLLPEFERLEAHLIGIRSMASGATMPSPRPETSTSRSSRILSQKGKSPGPTGCIAPRKERASAHHL